MFEIAPNQHVKLACALVLAEVHLASDVHRMPFNSDHCRARRARLPPLPPHEILQISPHADALDLVHHWG
eukprot:CAMPEP_0198613378 /NCGR_PEP_ID=MMETSP1462-20131121/158363_1 /TAXON_ID=1333877 /ORGANISM="Brandtodinium nutriculum, Strain RCC3387" /LENGTH=69 /DNA_ID=CAMNT_0044345177 /DNA_START=967 /DNA_END=1173 /DNA_ORIENTATION=+